MSQNLEWHKEKISKDLQYILKEDIEELGLNTALITQFFKSFEWSYILRQLFINADSSFLKFDKILVGVELILTSVYIKDDILDNTYRNTDTSKEEVNYGKNALLSDILFSKGLNIIAEEIKANFNSNLACEITQNILYGIRQSAQGQLLGCIADLKDYTIERSFESIRLKTVELLNPIFSIPSILLNRVLTNSYSNLASNLGFMLQIYNDITDCVSDQALYGKEIWEDLKNHQTNCVIATHFEYTKLKPDIIIDIWDKKIIDINRVTYKKMVDSLDKSSALKASMSLYLDYAEKVIESLSHFNEQTSQNNMLNFLKKHLQS